MEYWFELLLPPETSFRWILLGVAAVNVVICVLLEDGFVEYCIFRKMASRRCVIYEPSYKMYCFV